MEWRFSLIDRYGTRTLIDEPVGWDSFSIRVKRHQVRHGTFRELQGNTFQFFGPAAELLNTEYRQYGVRGKYTLLIEWKCWSRWEEFWQGIVSFDNFNYRCGAPCYVTVDIEQTGPLVTFINRFDQKVEVGKNVAFDGLTALTNYTDLKKEITLPSKAIVLRGIAKNTASQEYIISDDSGWGAAFPAGTGSLSGSINVPFNNVEVTSIQDFRPSSIVDFYNYSQNQEYTPELIYNDPNIDLNCVGTQYDVEFRIKGRYKNLNAGSFSSGLNLVLRKGEEDDTFNSVGTQIQFWPIPTGAPNVHTEEFDITYSGTITLDPGNKLWLNFFLTYVKTTNFTADVRIEFDAETYFKTTVISKCDPTTANVYLINETTSRVIEAITDGQLKLYSEHLGRTDSQPYSFGANGCGALRAVTVGLEIRKAKLSDGSDPKMFLSMKDIFDAVSAIDNIGLGEEGTDKIRIENWKWFYKNSVIMTCNDVDQIDISIRTDQHYSIFKNGYDKWEAEDYNGLDEFLTKREYRTDLNNIQNTLEQICKWIASGYAWEVTRRKGGTDKDWRYDNDVFIVCLDDEYNVEIDNISNAANIVDPPTVYNFRISPSRNAMRWFDRIAAAYRNISNADKLIFSSADGNYVAEGELTDLFCKLEAGVLKENDDINIPKYADQDDAKPINFADLVKYNFPMSANDFKKIIADPYGLIEYETSCESGAGWIDELEYFPADGKAKFSLIPKIPV